MIKFIKIIVEMEPKLLGEGSFGCVFSPSIPCESKPIPFRKTTKKQQLVSKVFSEKKEFTKELKMSKTAAKVDPTGSSILIPVSSCKTSRNKIMKHPEANKCDLLNEYPYQRPDKEMYQLIMPYGGERLDRYFRKMMEDGKSCKLRDALDILRPVFQGLVLLDEHNMCHQDIKSSNILVTPDGKAMLIDYSLMIPYKDVYDKKNLRRLRFTYFPYPPEYKIAYQTFTKCKEQCNYEEEVLANIRQFGTGKETAYLSFISEPEIRRHVRNVVKYVKHKPVLEICAKYANRIDVYGFGTSVVDISRFFSYEGVTQKQKSAWQKLVKGLIHPDMRKRLTAQQAFKQLESIRNMF